MRSLLGFLALLCALVLGGCGDDASTGEADDEPRGPVDFELVQVVSETAVGGEVSPEAVPLADVTAVEQFSAQFKDDRMLTKLIKLVNALQVPDDKATYAAVVAVGCEVPPDVTVTSTDTGISIESPESTEKPVECLAPMTSVAVVLLDESVVG